MPHSYHLQSSHHPPTIAHAPGKYYDDDNDPFILRWQSYPFYPHRLSCFTPLVTTETRTESLAWSHPAQLRSLSVQSHSPRLADSSFPFTASLNSVAAVSHPPTAQVARTVAPVPGHSMAAVSCLSSAQVARTSGTLQSLVSAARTSSPTRFARSCCLVLRLLRLCTHSCHSVRLGFGTPQRLGNHHHPHAQGPEQGGRPRQRPERHPHRRRRFCSIVSASAVHAAHWTPRFRSWGSVLVLAAHEDASKRKPRTRGTLTTTRDNALSLYPANVVGITSNAFKCTQAWTRQGLLK